jgi:hypothetical protein
MTNWGDVLVKAVPMMLLLAILKWWSHATLRGKLWAAGAWVVVMALGIWYVWWSGA